jgi:PAS domain S-box-containing protein
MLTGSVVMAGWLLGSERLKSLFPSMVSMKANTAAGFILCGASLWLFHRARGSSAVTGRRTGDRMSAVLAAIVVAIGVLTGVEWISGRSLGIDRLLFPEPPATTETTVPGRMAPATALNFVLTGAALLLLRLRKGARLVPLATLPVIFTSFLAVLSYAYETRMLRSLGGWTPMALHTALAFLVLTAGIVAACPDCALAKLLLSRTAGGWLARRLLPASFATPFVLGWIRLRLQHAGLYETETGVALFVIGVVSILSAVIWLSARMLDRAETAREESERAASLERDFTNAAIDTLPGLFYVIGEDAHFRQWNETFVTLSGLTPEQIARSTPEDFVPAGEREQVLARLAEAFAVGSATVEAHFVSADGRETPFFFTGKRIEIDSRPYVVGMGIDITARVAAEREVAAIEWMLTKPAAVAREVRVAPRPYGDLTRLNRERTILDAVGKDLLEDIVGDYMNLLETSSAVYEKNGDYALGIFSSGWCRSMDTASFRACGTDDPEKALACGKWECHESCWNEASRPSMVLNGPTDIACRGGIRLHAVPIRAGDEIIGSINFGYGDPPRTEAELTELTRLYPLAVEEMRQNADAYQTRPPFIIELAKTRLQGSARLIGEIVQRKRAEDALRQANERLERRVEERTALLEQANHELEAFTYSVSHDLRAPLRAIDGFTRILGSEYRSFLPPEATLWLDRLERNTKQMETLIDDLLTFSRLGKQPVKCEDVASRALVEECLEILQSDLQRTHAEVVTRDLPSCRGDGVLLRLVWMNLISNAAKYSRNADQPHIEIGAREADGEVIYYVKDNGVGFDMTYADKLFNIFQRLHRAEDYEGTGVGLATARRIIQRHGGRIWAESAPNRGATFSFTLHQEKAA